jgi:hypothetical protein
MPLDSPNSRPLNAFAREISMDLQEVHAAVVAGRIALFRPDRQPPRRRRELRAFALKARDMLVKVVHGGRLLDGGDCADSAEAAQQRYCAGEVAHPFQNQPYAICFGTSLVLVVPMRAPRPRGFVVQEYCPLLVDGTRLLVANGIARASVVKGRLKVSTRAGPLYAQGTGAEVIKLVLRALR